MNGNGFPTWIKVIAQVGFPIAVAVYYMVAVYPVVNATQAKMDSHIVVMEKHTQDVSEQTRLLRIICYNVSRTSFDRNNCDK